MPAPGEADEVADDEAEWLEAESLSLQAVTAPAAKVSKARDDRARYLDRRLRGVRDMSDPSATEGAVVPVQSLGDLVAHRIPLAPLSVLTLRPLSAVGLAPACDNYAVCIV